MLKRLKLTPTEKKEIEMIAKFERKHNTFFEENEIHCDYIHCKAGMGIAGMGKCFNKGNGKPDCPQFEDEEKWLESMGISK
jgi:hypothetical protein